MYKHLLTLSALATMLTACQTTTEPGFTQATQEETMVEKEYVPVPEPSPMQGKPKELDIDEFAAAELKQKVQKEYVAVGKPIPMPGQLKEIPKADDWDSVDEELATPQEIVQHANKVATQKPASSQFINSMMVYDYMPGALYQLHAAPGRVTDIMLEPGERMITTAAGDSVRWIVQEVSSGSGEKKVTHILVKPIRPGLETNVLITTDKRTYHLEAHSYRDTYMASITWNYPHEELLKISQEEMEKVQENKKTIDLNTSLDNVYFDYEVSSKHSPMWMPVRVFDDGTKTYIQFPKELKSSEAPVLFIRNNNTGAPQLVNYRVKELYYIVDRLFDEAELRVGEKKPEVVTIKRKR